MAGASGNQHGISLYNFDIQEEITINFPLAYLHGCIKYQEVNIMCVNRTLSHQEVIEWPVKDGEFKAFVYLMEGKNEICLNVSGENEVIINMNYRKISNSRHVLPIYIICKNSDGSFMAPPGVSNSTEDAVAKIQLNARLIQTYFAESLYEQGFKRKTICYAEDGDNKPVVKIINSEIDIEKIKEMTRDELYGSFQEELSRVLPKNEFRKLLCFMSCTRYNPPSDEKEFTVAKIQSYVTGHAALGGGNMALFGTGSLHTWASDLRELNTKFTDTTVVDRTKLFDDSAGRGTYMANYSTTLGAAIHELGHAFDLAHTPHGIMCRGHDDMDYFYTVVKSCQTDNTSVSESTPAHMINDTGKYKGAHWYRSSAVILNFNKWFNPSASEEENHRITKSLHPNVLGPVGNVGSFCQKEQVSFNSQIWLKENGLNLVGVVLYHHEFLCGIQFIGVKFEEIEGAESTGEEQFSDIFGTSPESAIKTTFSFDGSEERIERITVRSGAWIDGIEIQSNKKCSDWLGGTGGDVTVHKIDNDRSLVAVIGTAGEYVGGLGFVLNNPSNSVVQKDSITFTSENGMRLIETYKTSNGEVQFFKEYLDTAPHSFSFFANDLFISDTEKVNGLIYDDGGGKNLFTIDQLDLKLMGGVE